MAISSYLFWLSVAAIIYVYAGFPLVLTLLASIHPKRPQYFPVTPFVTLIIPAYNEEAVISQKIENSLSLDYPPERLQILVAADGSTDRTTEIVRAYAAHGIELSFNSVRQGKMAAINKAISMVRGEIVIFSDANNIFTPKVVRDLVTPFSDPEVGCVSGAKTIMRGDGMLGDSEGLYWRYEAYIKKQETRLGCCTSVAGEILAIRRTLIEPYPDNIINDDFYMAMRVIMRGYRVIYAPEARSLERISLSQKDEMTRRARIIAGRYQIMTMPHKLIPLSRPVLLWQIVSHKFLRPLVPFAMAGAIISNLFAVIWPSDSASNSLLLLAFPFNWIMLAFQTMFYGLALVGNRIRNHRTISRVLYLPTFLFSSNMAAIIGLYLYISKRQPHLWQRAKRRKIMDHLQD